MVPAAAPIVYIENVCNKCHQLIEVHCLRKKACSVGRETLDTTSVINLCNSEVIGGDSGGGGGGGGGIVMLLGIEKFFEIHITLML